MPYADILILLPLFFNFFFYQKVYFYFFGNSIILNVTFRHWVIKDEQDNRSTLFTYDPTMISYGGEYLNIYKWQIRGETVMIDLTTLITPVWTPIALLTIAHFICGSVSILQLLHISQDVFMSLSSISKWRYIVIKLFLSGSFR